MFSYLKISHRILASVVVGAVLTALISGLGIFGVRTIQRSMASATGVVQANIEHQNDQLRHKSRLSALAAQIAEARTLEDLDRLGNELKNIAQLDASPRGSASGLAQLARQVQQLQVAQREQVVREQQMARLSGLVTTNLGEMNEFVATLVAELETQVGSNTARSLSTLATDTRSQQTASEAALRELAARTEGTLKAVTAVLQVRAGIYELMPVIAQLRGATDKVEATRLLNEIRGLHANLQKSLKDIPADKATPVVTPLGQIQDKLFGAQGLQTVLLADLSRTTQKTVTTNVVRATNHVALLRAALVTNYVMVTNRSGTNLVASSSPVLATNHAIYTNLIVTTQVVALTNVTVVPPRLSARVVADLAALETTKAGLSKALLTLVDDTVFDSTLETENATTTLARQITGNAEKMRNGGAALADALGAASQELKMALTLLDGGR